MAEQSVVDTLEQKIKALEKENAYLKLFKFGMDNMPDSIYTVINRHYCHEAVSKGYCHLFNKQPHEIIGKPVSELLGDKTFQKHSKPNLDKALKGEVVNYSAWYDFSNKKIFMTVHYYPVQMGDGINSVALLINDLTQTKHAEEQYRNILKTAIDGFCLVDKQGRLIEVNDSYCRMLGYSQEELLQLNISDVDVVQTRGDRIRQCKETIQTGHGRFETKHRCKNGTLIDVEVNTQYSDIKNGAFICFIRDITEKNKTRDTLKKREQRYRKLFDGAPMMYVILKNKHGLPMITDCNRQFLNTLGYNREDVLGKPIFLFYTKASQKKVNVEYIFNRVRENLFTISERELVGRDGQVIDTLIQAVPEYDAQKNITGTRAMFIDISFRKKTEEQLKQSHELLQMIVNGISDPLVMVDKKMNLLMLNRSAEQYYKKDIKHCLGQKCHQALKGRQGPCPGCRVPHTILNGRQDNFERKGFMNPDNIEQVSTYPLMEKDNQVWAAVLRINDITRTRQIERELTQADKMISLGILVSGVAHEINNPTNFIMLNTPVLWEAWNGVMPVVEKYYRANGDFSLAGLSYSELRNEIPLLFSGIKEGAERIRRIVQDLKNFARQDDPHMDQPIDINIILEDSIRLTQNMIKDHTDRFSVEYSRNLPVFKGNKQKLEQVVINLIQNACQALPNKKKGIFISSSFDPTTGHIVVEVIDEGVGIPPKMLNRIMDPFFTTRRGDGGTGLGLAVSLNIVKAHGGKIEVTSDTANGSIFRIVIPTITFKKPIAILVADDDPGIRKYLRKALEDPERYSLRDAVNGKEALLKIGQKVPDLLILDIQMPDMDGFEVCSLFKDNPELSDIKVIIITGYPESSMVDDIGEMGFDNILAKPFTVTELKEKIDLVMEVEQ